MERVVVKYTCADEDLAFLTDFRLAFFLEASRVGFVCKYPELPIEFTLAPLDPQFDTSILGIHLQEVAHQHSRRAIEEYHAGIARSTSGDGMLEVPGRLAAYGKRYFKLGRDGCSCILTVRKRRIPLSLHSNVFQRTRLARLAEMVVRREARLGFRLTHDELEVICEKLRQEP